MELSERKKRILKTIIDEYISSGDPVGSKYLSAHSEFSVSSATIRNEMSELESMGYLEQPHASAGRVPSPLGYRVYVDGLMEQYRLRVEEISLLDELLGYKVTEAEKLLEQAGRVLSQITEYTCFTAINRHGAVAKRFEAVRIDGSHLLIVMICNDETVKTSIVEVNVPEGDTVVKLTEALNTYMTGISSDKISLPIILAMEEKMGKEREMVTFILKAVYELMMKDGEAKVSVSGLPKLLNYPEFSDPAKTKEVLELLDDKAAVVQTVLSSKPGDTHILIAGEEGNEKSDNTSLVYRPISINGENIGAVGIIGPRRMNYRHVIATLEYFAKNIFGEDG